jgi:dTDP-glucose 4,6-dehydratase
MIYYVDIDGTIAITPDNDYVLAKPYPEGITKINELFDKGHRIIYWTARGTTSGKDWRELTENQLKRWGCRYDELLIGNKPIFDFIIDDRALRIEEL